MYLCSNIKHNTMKKHLLLLLFVLAASAMQAQNGEMYSFALHNMGRYHFNIENAMRQHDGNIFINLYVGEDSGMPNQPPVNIGNLFYKMSPTTLTITDSLLVENPEAPYYLFAPNPNGEGNIRANFEYHENCDSTFLRICHFPDNDIHVNHDDDTVIPVCEGFAWGEFNSHLIDCRGNMIMKYYKVDTEGAYDIYMARFDPDGTLIHQALLFDDLSGSVPIPKMRVFGDSPLQYYEWGESENNSGPTNLAIHLIDSAFNANPVVINSVLSEESLSDSVYLVEYKYLKINYVTEVIPVGGDDVLVAASYTNDTNFDPYHAEYGVAVAKYDLRTQQRKGLVVYNDYPGETRAQCMGLKMMSDGTVYFLYREEGYPNGMIVVVKMDTDLNVEWKRFCKTDNFVVSAPLQFPMLFEDGRETESGIAWVGNGRIPSDNKPDLFYFFLKHDGTAGTNEGSFEVRPYSFYPNPAKNQFRISYSPDVQPKQIELYDLQGRPVGTQRSGLERIDMSRLPSGTYTMRVTMVDGKIYSDKVVKE